MKQGHFLTNIIALVFAAFIVGYLGVQIWRWVYDPIETVSAVYIESSDVIELDGFIVRDESVVTAASSGALEMVLGEGERAGKGDIIAAVYANEQALESHQLVLEADERIDRVTALINQGNEILDIDTADRTVAEQVRELMDMIGRNQLQNISFEVDELKNKTLSRVYIYQDRSGLTQVLEELKGERRRHAEKAQIKKRIYAPSAGYFSHGTDGYESVMTLSAAEEWTPLQVERLMEMDAVESSDGVIGKVVSDYKWNYVALISPEQAEYIGKTTNVQLRFDNGNYLDVDARIKHISPEENGKVLIVIECAEHIADFTLRRFAEAQLILRTYKGLRVPREALRVNPDGVNGVYCLIDSQAKFKQVNPIFEKDSYYIVAYDSTNTDSLLLYDEIIVAAKELENRKLVK